MNHEPILAHAKSLTTILSAVVGALLISGWLQSPSVLAATLTRTSSFDYEVGSGVLTKEVVEPLDSNLCVVTSYTLDGYGNRTGATTRNCNGSAGNFSGALTEAAAPSGDAVIQTLNGSGTLVAGPRSSGSTYAAGSSTINGTAYPWLAGQYPTSASNALSQSESRSFDPRFGSVLSLTGPNSLTTTWAYDSFGRKTLETRADGTRTQWDYQYCSGVNGGTTSCPTVGGIAGATVIVTTPLGTSGSTPIGPVSKTYYDALNREIRSETVGFDGSSAIYRDTQYDVLGRVAQVSRPYYSNQSPKWISTSYDALSRVTAVRQPDDGTYTDLTTHTTYNGLAVTVTDPKDNTQTTVKNSQGQVVSITDTLGKTLTYQYDPVGNLKQTHDSQSNVTSLSYDTRGRKTQMVDRDMGTWTYAYDALGQMIRQVDAKAQTTTLAYDLLGRLQRRIEADLTSTWTYDSCTKGVGKLCSSATSTAYSQTLTYDSLGRPSGSSITIDSPFTSSVTYDSNTGRLATQTYPSGLQVKYLYTSLGYLQKLQSSDGSFDYWTASTLDAEAHLLTFTHGESATYTDSGYSGPTVTAVNTSQNLNAANGRITAITAGAGNGIQDFAYTYDKNGNLTIRQDNVTSVTETFGYDGLNRLVTSQVGTNAAKSYTYDAVGNLTGRSDWGSYTYPNYGPTSVRPHAVSSIAITQGAEAGHTVAFAYDANGNLTGKTQSDAGSAVVSARSRSTVWNSFNMPNCIVAANGITSCSGNTAPNTQFWYGPEHQRIKQSSSQDGTTWYLNPDNAGGLAYEKDQKPDASIEQRHFLSAYGQVVAIVKCASTCTSRTLNFLHRDNLGSTTAITDASGTVIERLAYEPFGKRRLTNGNDDSTDSLTTANTTPNSGHTTSRGFTNHEMLDELGLVHMNGRIYDPQVGRFMSADFMIPDARDMQSYNRYSYVLNNPLIYTDPTGQWNFGRMFAHAWKELVWHNEIGRPILAIAVAYATGNAGLIEGAPAANAAVGGFAGGFVGSGGTLRGSVSGAISAYLFFEAGTLADNLGGAAAKAGEGMWAKGGFGRAMLHAGAGCVGSAMGAGGCRSGAVSAGFSEAVGGRMSFNNEALDMMAHTVIGGMASELAGGTFENGAVTGAFGYLFNYCAHNGCFNRKFTLADAKLNWQQGNGAPITDVGANELNLAGAGYIATNTPGVFQVNLSSATDSYYVYGTVTGVLDANGNMSFRKDTYNFDYKDPALGQTTGEMARLVARNGGTFAGRVYNGSGTGYEIHFSGSQALPAVTINRLRNCAPGSAC